ncbi:MAG: thrombospondin type 3 repeat-containing protein, partial [Myxococcota bacterium]
MFRSSLAWVVVLAFGCSPEPRAPDQPGAGSTTGPDPRPPLVLIAEPWGIYSVTGASPVVTQPIDWVDTDGDGIDDVSEAFYGTDPNNA